MRTLRKAVLAFVLLSLAALPSIPALALLVRPVLIDLTTSGSGVASSLEVVNDRNRPIAVEVKVNKLSIPERGDVVVTADEGNDFQIFPPIASIPPGGRQVFRVRWVGESALPETRLFMFSTSELPVDEVGNDATVQVLYAIQSVVAVRPPQARPDISLGGIRRAKGREGQDGVEITFVNAGPAHGYVNTASLRLSVQGSNWSHQFSAAELNNAFGLGLVPPNGRRAMCLPVSDLPANGTVNADIQLPKGA